jgi:hypothetical protein
MQLNLRSLTGQTVTIRDVEPSSTIAELKSRIETSEGIPAGFQRLIFGGGELEDSSTISTYNITEDCVVHLVVKQNHPLPPQSNSDRYVPDDQIRDSAVVQINFPAYYGDALGSMDPSDIESVIRRYQFSRAIRMFAVIDGIFLVLWSLRIPLTILALPLVISGYYGAKNYQIRYLFAYMFYILLNIAARLVLSAVFHEDGSFIFLNILGILLEVYIFSLVNSFRNECRNLSDEQRDQMILLENPVFAGSNVMRF